VLVDVGEKVHVVERRLFEGDVRRHFFGVVERAGEGAIRITGYAYVYDPASTTYIRSAEQRTRVLPLAASGFVINVAPPDADLESIRYEERDGRLTVTDGAGFSLDINEFGRHR